MKILQLRFKNLNSLAGEWKIDFTVPEYTSDGIFAISGPTGAGKSTIMDAICLALYGRTPRLKGISKNSNEIMSRHTGECFSEVVFETQKGQFRCTWSQHRAGKKATGKLQDSNHEMAEFVTGKILESKKTDVANAIVAYTGMDFARFTQSMLLAQGGFAAFLQADPDERAPILEQITGTEIYSEISKLVHERRRNEIGKLDVLKAETTGITILTEEEENLLNLQLSDIQKSETELATKKITIDQSILWLNGMETIKKELTAIANETIVHSLTLQNFEPERIVLKNAVLAAGLDGEYASLTVKRKLQSDELVVLTTSEQKVPDLFRKLELAELNHADASKALTGVKQETESGLIQIKMVRDLDIRIKEKQTVLKKGITEHKEILSAETAKIEEKKVLQSQILALQTALENIGNYLITNANDALLVTELTGIKEKLRNLKEAKINQVNLGNQLTELRKLLAKAEQQTKIQWELFQNKGKTHAEAQKMVTRTQQILANLLGERLLREYRNDLTNLMKEVAYLRKIADLETERQQLHDNQPCPLCGALQHPYAEGNVPKLNETERRIDELVALINQADKLEASQKLLEADEKRLATELVAADKQLQQAQNNNEASQLAINNKLAEHTLAFENYTIFLNALAFNLQSFGITEMDDTDPVTLSSLLDQRLLKWQDHQQKQTTIAGQINGLSAQIETSNVLIKTLGDSLTTKLNENNAYRTEVEELIDQRTKLYGSKNPDTEELRLTTMITASELSERAASDQKNRLLHELAGLKERIKELEARTAIRKQELNMDEVTFLTSLQTTGFDDESAFTGCRISKERRDQLGRQASALDLKQADIDTRKKDREERLILEETKKLTEIPLDDLIEQQQVAGISLITFREEIWTKRKKLNDNVVARERFSKITVRIEAQKSECRRWEALYNLIGSADGKKYRNFAQGLTFEIMVAHANLQLMKLTDRYLLVRDKEQPLDLNVIDNYQAGEVRSTKNLSGGESFIVSLALALGLSKMASKKVRVDSLFLDEGFGTLDEDTLETALETLASLRQDGKLIGVISHVSALKERISTKILVQKVSGGKSILSGPGCSKVN